MKIIVTTKKQIVKEVNVKTEYLIPKKALNFIRFIRDKEAGRPYLAFNWIGEYLFNGLELSYAEKIRIVIIACRVKYEYGFKEISEDNYECYKL